MFLGAVVIGIVYLVFALGAGAYLSRKQLASSPLPHLDHVMSVFGEGATILMLVIGHVVIGSAP